MTAVATPLLVNVVELLRRPGTVKEVLVSVACDDLTFDDPRIVDEPVEVALRLESLSNGIVVDGSVSATWHGECRRCLAPIRVREAVGIEELYQRVVEDPDAHPIVGEQIDLLPMVRENVLVSLPVGPLCRPDCPGFCGQCGADLSEGPCGCEPVAGDPRWSALDALKERPTGD